MNLAVRCWTVGHGDEARPSKDQQGGTTFSPVRWKLPSGNKSISHLGKRTIYLTKNNLSLGNCINLKPSFVTYLKFLMEFWQISILKCWKPASTWTCGGNDMFTAIFWGKNLQFDLSIFLKWVMGLVLFHHHRVADELCWKKGAEKMSRPSGFFLVFYEINSTL